MAPLTTLTTADRAEWRGQTMAQKMLFLLSQEALKRLYEDFVAGYRAGRISVDEFSRFATDYMIVCSEKVWLGEFTEIPNA